MRREAIHDSDDRRALRVVFYCDGHEVGGAEIHLGHLLAGLTGQVEPTVIVTDRKVAEHLCSRRSGARIVELDQIRRATDVRTIGRHARAIARARPDVVQISLNRPWGSQWAVLTGLGLVGVRSVGMHHSPRSPTLITHRLYLRLIPRLMTRQVVTGEIARGAVISLTGARPGRVVVIPNGVPDLSESPRKNAAGGKVIGTVARLHHVKGLDVLIRAMPSLPGVKLVLVGDGEEREPLDRLAAAEGVSDRVQFVGWSEQVETHLAGFDVFVLPSRMESLPLSVLEAMLARLPVVATDVGGVSEAVVDGQTGTLVPAHHPAALARAIQPLLADPKAARLMGEAGRARALEYFTSERMASSFERLYAELSADGP